MKKITETARSERVATWLFWAQLAIALGFSGFQLYQMIYVSIEGLSISAIFFSGTFAVINLILAINAYKAKSDINTRRACVIYITGSIAYLSFLVAFLANQKVIWNSLDWLTVSLVLIGVAGVGWWKVSVSSDNVSIVDGIKASWNDPMGKGFNGLVMKAVPQAIMAVNIFMHGSKGLNVVMVLAFHAMTTLRLYQINESIKADTEEKNRRGLMASEIGNEASWLLVTISWCIMEIGRENSLLLLKIIFALKGHTL